MTAFLLALILAFAQTAPAQQAMSDARIEEITTDVASQLRCPVCQGLSIQDSPSGLAREMRGVIRDQIADGRTPEEVKAYFVSKYGEWVLLAPPARGFNLTVYLLPVLAVLGGAALIVFLTRRWSRRPALPADAPSFDDPDLAPWDEATAER
jgi:cytochrome c-type biogenesis protein CcmH